MKKAVIFKSLLGTTEKYARTLGEKIDGDVYRWYIVNDRGLAQYDLVVICSGPYDDWEPLAEFIETHWTVLKDQKVIVVAVGEIPDKEGAGWKPHEKIPEAMAKQIKIFELPGKLNPETADEVKMENVDVVVEYIKEIEDNDGAGKTEEKETAS